MLMKGLAGLMLSVTTSFAMAQEMACPPPLEGAAHAMTNDIQTNNSCILPPDGPDVTAVSSALFAGSARCGECLLVEGAGGTVVVRVISDWDLCPTCADTDLDLSPSAFLAVTGQSNGREPVTWQRVACPVSGPVKFRFSNSSNEWYLELQALDHRYGIQSMALVVDGTEYDMPRASYNHFIAQYDTHPMPVSDVTVRVTATTGQSLLQSFGPLPDDSGTVIAGSEQFTHCEPVIFRNGFEPGAP